MCWCPVYLTPVLTAEILELAENAARYNLQIQLYNKKTTIIPRHLQLVIRIRSDEELNKLFSGVKGPASK